LAGTFIFLTFGKKSKPIFDLLEQTNHDWEAVVVCLLAKNFGLNTNGEIFLKSQNIPFQLLEKKVLRSKIWKL
jgi:hypothetical protein